MEYFNKFKEEVKERLIKGEFESKFEYFISGGSGVYEIGIEEFKFRVSFAEPEKFVCFQNADTMGFKDFGMTKDEIVIFCKNVLSKMNTEKMIKEYDDEIEILTEKRNKLSNGK